MHAEACIMGAMQIEGWNGFWVWQKDGMHAGACITGVTLEEGQDGFGIGGGKGCIPEATQREGRDACIVGTTPKWDGMEGMHPLFLERYREDAWQRMHADVPEGDEGSRSPGCILIKPLTSG
jgi:hypothetical protein